MYIQINDDFDKELENAEYYDANHDEKLVSFGPVSTINLFVGANNSSKSRFLRKLILNDKFIYSKDYFNSALTIPYLIENFESLIDDFRVGISADTNPYKRFFEEQKFEEVFNEVRETLPYLSYFFIEEKKTNINISNHEIEKIIELLNEKNKSIIEMTTELLPLYKKFSAFGEVFEAGVDNVKEKYKIFLNNDSDEIVQRLKEALGLFDLLFNQYFSFTETNSKIYIPILRSSYSLYNTLPNSIQENKKIEYDIFETTIGSHYNLLKENKGLELFTGLKLYQLIKKYRNSFKDKRILFEEFEKFIGITFFNTEEFEIVARESEKDSDQHIIVSIKGEEKDIHNLGDGIQSLITLLFPIYMAEKDAWIFIEEPEINLHPGMQRIFLEQLTKEPLKSKNLKYFITTHSNHLLDLSLEMGEETSIFTFDKKISAGGNASFEIKNVKSGDTDVLNLLGVKNSSVFMANCTIWVEGITDRYYIREFLKAYHKRFNDCEKFKEDLHYAFFEYAGTNIEHYIFEEPGLIKETDAINAQFLSNKILLVADKDKGKDKKHLEREFAQYKNFQLEVLTVREVENLLSEENLSELLPKIYAGFKSKIDFTKIKFLEYKEEYLAKYLETTFGSNVVRKAFIAQSGTIKTKYKLDLALAAKDNLTWENMSEPAKELTQNIYTFIEKANS